MGHLFVQAVLPYTTLLPEDVAVNTFSFKTDGSHPSGDDLDHAEQLLEAFYNDDGAGGPGIGRHLGSVVSRPNCKFYMYEPPSLSGGAIGSPLRVSSWTLVAVSTSTFTLPLEVAVAASYRSTGGGGSSAGRRRGRIFLGPMGNNSLDTTTTYPGIKSQIVSDIAFACQRLAQDSNTLDMPWSVWSRADAALRPIDMGFVNNEYDTQRRRQRPPTSRDTWSLSV